MFDRLPVPFGLARYGIAPDHLEAKNCLNKFKSILENPNISFFGNISVPEDVGVSRLTEAYNAIVLSTGAWNMKSLSIPGNRFAVNASSFVGWYNGHPEANEDFDLESTKDIAIIGNGNVALDCARVLLAKPAKFKETDISSRAFDVLTKSGVENVRIIGRRGPFQAAFTMKEIREIMNLENINVHISSLREDIERFASAMNKHQLRRFKRLTDLVDEVIKKSHCSSNRNLFFDFFQSPDSIEKLGDGRLRLNLNHMELRDTNTNISEFSFSKSGKMTHFDCDLLLQSVGFKPVAISGVPFDEEKSLVPNEDGRVYNPKNNSVISGLYVSGWLKTGPKGVIADTMHGAHLTGGSLVHDYERGLIPLSSPQGIKSLPEYQAFSSKVVEKTGVLRILKHESFLGVARRKPAEKIISIEEMMRTAGV